MQVALYTVLRGPEWMDSRTCPPGAPSTRQALELVEPWVLVLLMQPALLPPGSLLSLALLTI